MKALDTIIQECLRNDGFAIKIRENCVDYEGFARLLAAVQALTVKFESRSEIDRIVVACLFELPWEIENTIAHYTHQSAELGATVSRMADSLREAIHALLWAGLNQYTER
jgi:hypothetical protein